MWVQSKVIVISGINLFEGGPLSIYKDLIDAIIDLKLFEKNKIVLLVHRYELFQEHRDKFEIVQFPKSRNSYFNRLYYEYFRFYTFSKKTKVDYWISLHDITPNVVAKHRFTYCHQPTPFYKAGLMDWRFSKKTYFFSKLYGYLYGINIKKNDAVIVQQDWIRNEFIKKYRIQNVIVARPDKLYKQGVAKEKKKEIKRDNQTESKGTYTFIYASYARTFKNFEVVCEACRLLENRKDYCVLLTLDGVENSYSKYLVDKYRDISQIKWIGIQSREKLYEYYNTSDCMIFPSKLETWGLPISEFKQTSKPIIMADLPYAHETIGEYEKTDFFKFNDEKALAKCMLNAIIGGDFKGHYSKKVLAPYVRNWTELCELIFKE